MGGIFLNGKDVMILIGCSSTTAYDKIDKVKIHLKKEKHQGITLEEFCNYYGCSLKAATEKLNPKSKAA